MSAQRLVSQELSADSLLAKLWEVVKQNDSCLRNLRFSFHQRYVWEIIPIGAKLSGLREITVEKNANTRVEVLVDSGGRGLVGKESMLKWTADLTLAKFLPADRENLRVDFSPLGETVMINGELHHVVECYEKGSKGYPYFQRTYWITSQSFELVRLETLAIGAPSSRSREIMSKTTLELSRPMNFPCLVPVNLVHEDFNRSEIGPVTTSRLTASNTDFAIR